MVRDFALYIFFLLDVVSIFRVQSRGPIRNCNNNITSYDNSLTQCWPRALWVTQVVCVNGNNAGRSICERYLFLNKRKSWRALNPTKNEKLIPKIANLKQSGLTSVHLCCLWGAQNRCFLICNETVALVKSGNVKRHYETKHAHFEQKYPQNSEVRGRKINHLQSYQATC